ncbi:hypothetical protein [Cupriavidus necator]
MKNGAILSPGHSFAKNSWLASATANRRLAKLNRSSCGNAIAINSGANHD